MRGHKPVTPGSIDGRLLYGRGSYFPHLDDHTDQQEHADQEESTFDSDMLFFSTDYDATKFGQNQIKRSRQNAANYWGSNVDGQCEHARGFVSFADHYDMMEARDGQPPKAIDLYLEAHMLGQDGKMFRSNKSRNISEAYQTVFDQASELAHSTSDPPNVDPNKIFLRAIEDVQHDIVSTSTGLQVDSSQRAEINTLRELIAMQASKIELLERKLERMDKVEADLAMMRNMFSQLQKKKGSKLRKKERHQQQGV